MTEIIIIGIMGGLLAIQGYLHARERKDLYNRIMARDLTEYSNTHPTQTRPPPKSRNFVFAGLKRYYDNKFEAGE